MRKALGILTTALNKETSDDKNEDKQVSSEYLARKRGEKNAENSNNKFAIVAPRPRSRGAAEDPKTAGSPQPLLGTLTRSEHPSSDGTALPSPARTCA